MIETDATTPAITKIEHHTKRSMPQEQCHRGG
jgi:hypothetical protein